MRNRVSPDLSSRSVTLAATECVKALVAVIIESLVNIAIHSFAFTYYYYTQNVL